MLRTLLKVGGILAAIVLVAALSLTWVVVRVVQADGPTIIVPAPAILGQAVLALTSAKDQEIRLHFDLADYRQPGLELIRELRSTPDAQLLRVDRSGEQVAVWKQGERIRVEVETDKETVKLNVPIDALEAFLQASEGDGVKLTRLAGIVGAMGSGKAVEVRSADADIDIWIW